MTNETVDAVHSSPIETKEGPLNVHREETSMESPSLVEENGIVPPSDAVDEDGDDTTERNGGEGTSQQDESDLPQADPEKEQEIVGSVEEATTDGLLHAAQIAEIGETHDSAENDESHPDEDETDSQDAGNVQRSHSPVEETAVITVADPSLTEVVDTAEVASIVESERNVGDAPVKAESTSDNDEEFTSRAAIALAAVAVAANAQHSSPAAAAQAARALAPGIMPGAGMSPRRNQDMKVVSIQAVKQFMKAKAPKSVHAQKLANGENDAFLQHLLLLEYFLVDDESSNHVVPASPSKAGERILEIEEEEKEQKAVGMDGIFDQELVALAADRVLSMLAIVDGAYDSMVGLLPSVPQPEEEENDVDVEFDGIEAPAIVPDLLPTCGSTTGDATAEFFRECAGNLTEEEHSGKVDTAKAVPQRENAEKESKDKERHLEKASEDDGSSSTGHSGAASVFSSMFTSVKRSTIGSPRTSLSGVFRKRSRRHLASDANDRDSLARSGSKDDGLADGEYSVLIEREMLGLTVENVLERTVVRTVLPGGAAKAAGAQVGSLIVKVGNVETKNLTHFETIDELRQSQRPLRLVMRRVSTESLSLAREEMGRLIRGAGFGAITGGGHESDEKHEAAQHSSVNGNTTRPNQIQVYSRVLHERWTSEDAVRPKNGEIPLDQAGEKLVWILTLMVHGLECEATKMSSLTDAVSSNESLQEKQQHHHHTAKDYSDAAKSISRVMVDYIKKKLCPENLHREEPTPFSGLTKNAVVRRGRRGAPPPPPPGARGGTKGSAPALTSDKPLLWIGDVLHRTYTFLADPTSPPAALLRGEVIAFLCDVLDIDAAMELSEEESASSTAGHKAGPISDLGSAGSLLKLIVLNCSMMRSPGCGTTRGKEDLAIEQRRRFGLQRQFSTIDAHRLHAGNRFLAVVHRLAASRSLSARVTACSLGPVLWGHLDFPHQLQVSSHSS